MSQAKVLYPSDFFLWFTLVILQSKMAEQWGQSEFQVRKQGQILDINLWKSSSKRKATSRDYFDRLSIRPSVHSLFC